MGMRQGTQSGTGPPHPSTITIAQHRISTGFFAFGGWADLG